MTLQKTSAVATPVRFESNKRVRDVIPLFYRFPSPRILAAYLSFTLIGRVWAGAWSWWDLAVVAIILALQPFTEWTIHTFVLHFRPRPVGGRPAHRARCPPQSGKYCIKYLQAGILRRSGR